MTPIRHIICGSIIAWYIGDKNTYEMRSIDALLLNGEKPPDCSMVKCPKCGYIMGGIRRCFDEDLKPDFDISEALRKRNESLIIRHKPVGKSLSLFEKFKKLFKSEE